MPFSIEQITARIQEVQQLAAEDPKSALKKNQDLFLDLAKQDEAYIVPESKTSIEALDGKTFAPYIAAAQEGDPRLFLHIFSHRDVAQSFAEQLGHDQICKVDGVELMQLARYHFVRGIYGFLLNGNREWAALGFPDFLMDCFTQILGDSTLAREEYVLLIKFINMVRQNDYYHIQCGRQTLVDAERPERVLFVDKPDSLWTNCAGDIVYEECGMSHLLRAAKADPNRTNICIKTAKTDLQVTPEALQAALNSAGLMDTEDRGQVDFRTSVVVLDYQMEDFDPNPLPQQMSLATLPRSVSDDQDREPEREQEEAPEETAPGQGRGERIKTAIAAIVARLFPKKQKTSETEEPAAQEPDKEGKSPKKKFTVPIKKLIPLFFAAAFILIAVAFIGSLLKPSPQKNLETAIDKGDYTHIQELYNDCVNADRASKEELLPYLADDLQAKLDAYAADELTATQLAEIIFAYEAIPAMSSRCESIYEQASALEQSKLTYQKGILEQSVLSRLAIWKGIIAEDTGSMAAIRKTLDENAKAYKAAAFAEIEDMEIGEALAGLELLQSYYPNDPEVAKQTKDWLDKVSKPSMPGSPQESEVPVTVNDVYLTLQDGVYDLHISWENTSEYEIEEVLFTVTPLNSDGDPVYTKGDYYSTYRAITPEGPFAPGYTMPDGELYWASAWINEEESICAVRLDSVQVFFSNGESVYLNDAILFEDSL